MGIEFTNDFSGNKRDDLKEGNYFIIDWIVNNPMKPDVGTPRIIVANASEADITSISAGSMRIPNPTVGAKYRVILKIDKINPIHPASSATLI